MASIVSSFAHFLAVDNRTASFSNPSFARVCIEMDFAKPPPDQVWIVTSPQEGFWLKLIYENNLLYCSKCRLHGHNLETCRKDIQRREEDQRIWSARDDHGLPVGKPKGAYIQPPLDDKQEQQDSRPAALPDSGNQGWTVVQKRKQKKKSFKQARASQMAYAVKETKRNTEMGLQAVPIEARGVEPGVAWTPAALAPLRQVLSSTEYIGSEQCANALA
ncbi:hypothetical protein QQ045_027903 [Rhodiola kirilowii]